MFYIPWLWPFRKYSEERAMSHGLYGLCVHVVGGTHVSCAGIPFPIPFSVSDFRVPFSGGMDKYIGMT